MADDTLTQLIQYVGHVFEGRRVPYAITGSIASSVHGEPVTSLDVDIVTQFTPQQADELARDFSPRMYADARMLREAAENHAMVNLYDRPTGYKVDISSLPDTPYYAEVMKRRVHLVSNDLDAWFVSPEDIILMKLIWRIDTRSRKQWDNALSVARIQGNRLDWAYLRHWSTELGVSADLEQLITQAGI